VFVVASLGLRIYVSYVYTHGLTYGALATPITFLLFYYMMSLAIVLGAQFNNATLEYFPARISRRELRKWRRYEASSGATPQVADAYLADARAAQPKPADRKPPSVALPRAGHPADQSRGSDR
jgi:membrane protein